MMKNIVQVAIVCRDIEATAKRWAAILNQPVPKISTTTGGQKIHMIVRGKPSDAKVKLAFFDTGPCTLELLQPLGGDSAWQEGLDMFGESVHHIAFRVQDSDKTIAALKEQGMEMIHRGNYDSNEGEYVYIDSKRQLGVTIELLHSFADKKK